MNNNLIESLKENFGFSSFNDGQKPVIEKIINGESTLAIFPTGSGKSLCYQLSALHLPHLTLVVSPLLALMKDQLDFLDKKGIKARSINSSLTPEENRNIMNDIKSGAVKILMVSVERFKNERFRQFISSIEISMLVVDEAHCISEWGHNFRPDYLKLPSYKEELNIPLVLLLTATATRKVKLDMAKKFNIEIDNIVQTGFYRKNLDLSVVAVSSQEKNQKLIEVIKKQSGAGIVYVTLQKTAEEVASFLKNNQINAVAYHAGYSSENRERIQNDFMNKDVEIVVATIAFGMGIDKSDLRFVIHYDLPKSIENYSQEIGRAGRDGLSSNCVTLANLDGINTMENFVFGDTPELDSIEYLINDIKENKSYGKWELQIYTLSRDSNIKQLPLKTLLVQMEIMGIIRPLYSYFAEFKYKLSTEKEAILETFRGEPKEFLTAIFENTKFKKVWGELDFESLLKNYECDRPRVLTALEHLQNKQLITLETKKMTEVFEVNSNNLNQEGLAKELHKYFHDKEKKEISRIDYLVKFFELDRCLSHCLSLYFDDKQTPENCGHCSVCRGEVAKLDYSKENIFPDQEKIKQIIRQLKEYILEKTDNNLSLELTCKFLAGITSPIFTRYKVKKEVNGFGICQNIRYELIRKNISEII